jgi:hypothetical protein
LQNPVPPQSLLLSSQSGQINPTAPSPSQIYSNTAIECALVVRAVFHLSLRATQGFLESVVRLMEVNLPVPAYSTVCRRQAGVEPRLQAAPARKPRHVVIDTTGLKVFGAGEWYVRKHGVEKSRRRTWRKLHLCVDEASKDIVAMDLTTSDVHDSPHLPAMLERVEGEVGQVSAVGTHLSGLIRLLDAGGGLPCPTTRNTQQRALNGVLQHCRQCPIACGSTSRDWERFRLGILSRTAVPDE